MGLAVGLEHGGILIRLAGDVHPGLDAVSCRIRDAQLVGAMICLARKLERAYHKHGCEPSYQS